MLTEAHVNESVTFSKYIGGEIMNYCESILSMIILNVISLLTEFLKSHIDSSARISNEILTKLYLACKAFIFSISSLEKPMTSMMGRVGHFFFRLYQEEYYYYQSHLLLKVISEFWTLVLERN